MFNKIVRKYKGIIYRPVIIKNPIKPKQTLRTRQSFQKHNVSRVGQIYCTHGLVYMNLFKYLTIKQSTVASEMTDIGFLNPPEGVKGMTKLDKSAFDSLVKVPALFVPVETLGKISKKLKQFYLKMPSLNQIVELDKNDPRKNSHRLILLDPTLVKTFQEINVTVGNILTDNGLSERDFSEYEIKLGYENWSCSEVLHAVTQENVTGFTLIGHICHFNLKEFALPYKSIIGEVILDKLPAVKTVVNKTNIIDNTYRSFQMELMAGEPNYITQTKENGMTFELDFSKVYWNSRLGTEHQRVVDCISEGDIVYDVFAGVGPFAIPAVKKKKAFVFANDLNPVSYEYLQKNVNLNKIKSGIECFNMDGRDFIKSVVKRDLLKRWQEKEGSEQSCHLHVIMNLPALAIEFLDAFKGLIKETEKPESFDKIFLPKVYCYCFIDHNTEASKKALEVELETATRDRVRGILGESVDRDMTIRYVRKVAPNKEMMCTMFSLTWDVLVCQTSSNASGEPKTKYRKTDESNGGRGETEECVS